MITQEMLNIIVCPVSKEKLNLADEKMLAEVKEKISTGIIKSNNDLQVSQAMDALLVNTSGTLAYPVHGGIPLLLPDEALSLK